MLTSLEDKPDFVLSKLRLCFPFIYLNVLSSGWAMAPEERDWKYRLSIYYAKRQDSGTFTCATPRGITNSITVYVKC